MAKKLEVVLTGDSRGVSKTFNDVERRAGGFSSKMGAVGKKVAKAFAIGAAGIAAGAAVIGVGLYKIGSEFDAAYDKIRVATGATGVALKGLEADFKAVVSSVPASFDDASVAVSKLNQRLGITGVPLQALSAQFLELSRITDTDVGQNVDNLTRVFGDWGISAKYQGDVMDRLFRASQATGIGIDELSTSLVKFGAPLRNLGFSMNSSTALLALFNKTGVNTGTVFAGLKAGVGKLAKAGEDVPATFRRIVKEITKLGPGTKATALAIELFGQRAGPDLADAITGGKFQIDSLLKTIATGGDTIMQAGKDTADFSEKWKLLKNKIMVGLEPLAAKVFGGVGTAIDKLAPIVTEAIGGFKAFVAAFKAGGNDITSSGLAGFLEGLGLKARAAFDKVAKAWPRIRGAVVSGAKAIVQAFKRVVAAVRPVVEAFARFTVANPKPVLIGVATAIGVVTVAWAAYAIAQAAALWPIYAVIAAIGLVSGGLVYAYQKVGWFHSAVDAVGSFLKNTLWPTLQTIAQWLGEKLPQAFAWASAFITNTLVPALQSAWAWFQVKILPSLQSLASFLQDAFSVAWTAASAAVQWLADKLPGVYDWFATYILPVIKTVAGALGYTLVHSLEQAASGLEKVIAFLRTAWAWFSVFILPTLKTVAGFMAGGFVDSLRMARQGVGFIVDKAKALWSILVKIKNAASDVVSAISKLPGAGAVGGILSKIPGFATGGVPPVGMPYLVGERGPEIRIDSRPGVIIPNDRIRAAGRSQAMSSAPAPVMAGGDTVVVVQLDGKEISRHVVNQQNGQTRASGRPALVTR